MSLTVNSRNPIGGDAVPSNREVHTSRGGDRARTSTGPEVKAAFYPGQPPRLERSSNSLATAIIPISPASGPFNFSRVANDDDYKVSDIFRGQPGVKPWPIPLSQPVDRINVVAIYSEEEPRKMTWQGFHDFVLTKPAVLLTSDSRLSPVFPAGTTFRVHPERRFTDTMIDVINPEGWPINIQRVQFYRKP
jgi:hypothetical protein